MAKYYAKRMRIYTTYLCQLTLAYMSVPIISFPVYQVLTLADNKPQHQAYHNFKFPVFAVINNNKLENVDY